MIVSKPHSVVKMIYQNRILIIRIQMLMMRIQILITINRIKSENM